MLFGAIEFGPIDPAALVLSIMTSILALVAILFTWNESRRNNSVILKVRECKARSEQSIESGGRIYHEFEIWIQNRGISIYNVAIALGFHVKDGGGWLTCPLHTTCMKPGPEITGVPTITLPSKHKIYFSEYPEFARGMVVKFYLNSAQQEPGADRFFRMLENPYKQKATLSVYAQDYLAYSFRVGGFWDKVKTMWNGFASWFNNLFTHSHGLSAPPSPPGSDIMHTPKILPQFVTLEHGIMCFISALLQDAERAKKGRPG